MMNGGHADEQCPVSSCTEALGIHRSEHREEGGLSNDESPHSTAGGTEQAAEQRLRNRPATAI